LVNTSTPECTAIARAQPVSTMMCLSNFLITSTKSGFATPDTALHFSRRGRAGRRRRRSGSGFQNLKRRSWLLLLWVDTLATTLNRAVWIELYQVGSDNTLGTSDVTTAGDLLRAFGGILFRHHQVTGLAAVEWKPALRRRPELTVLASVLGRLGMVFFALDRLEAPSNTETTRDKGLSVNVKLEGHLGSLG